MMFDVKNASLSIVLLMATASIAAAASGHTDHATVRAAFARRGAAVPHAAATPKPSPLLAFTMQGTATSTFDDTDACPDVTCNSSGGDCNCLSLQGTVSGTQVGNATWNSDVTINTDDCVNTGSTTGQGQGFCCFAGGPLNIVTGGGSSSTLGMSFTGLLCVDPNAALTFSVQGGFIITGANGSGKFANSAGTGQLDMSVADDAAGSAYLSGNGVLQVVSPSGQ